MMTRQTFRWAAITAPLFLFVVLWNAFGAGTVTVPNTFTPLTTASAAQVNQNFTVLANQINANVSTRKHLGFNSGTTDLTVTADYELFRTVGTFAKLAADTDVIVTLEDDYQVNGGNYGDFQVRVDGTQMFNGAGRALIFINLGSTQANQAVETTAWFIGLAAGNHSVEIWSRGSATSLSDNVVNVPHNCTVEETPSR